MNKKQIAKILMEDNTHGIPVFLNIDSEDIHFDLKKTNGFIFFGQNRKIMIQKLINEMQSNIEIPITNIKSCKELDLLYDEFILLRKEQILTPTGLVVVVDDLEIFKDEIHQKKIIEIFQMGHSVGYYFICGMENKKNNQITAGFSVSIELFYNQSTSIFDAKFDYIGTIQKIKIKN